MSENTTNFNYGSKSLNTFAAKYPSVTRHIEQMQLSSRTHSSVHTFLIDLRKISKDLHMTPDEIIDHTKALSNQDLQRWIDDAGKKWVNDKNTRKTRRLKFTVIKSFLKANYVYNARDLEQHLKGDVENDDICPTDDDIIQIIVACADTLERLGIYMFTESGVRESTLNSLTFGDFSDLDKHEDVIAVKIGADQTKCRVRYIALFGLNTQNELRRLRAEIESQGIVIKPTDPVMCKIEGGKLLPRTTHSLSIKFTHVIERAHLRGKRSDSHTAIRYELRVHSLRKYLETKLETNRVNHEIVQRLIGHTVSTYSKPQLDDLKAEYRRVMIPTTHENREKMIVEYAKGLGVIDPNAYPTTLDAREYPPTLAPLLPKLKEYFGVEMINRMDRNGCIIVYSDTGGEKIDLTKAIPQEALTISNRWNEHKLVTRNGDDKHPSTPTFSLSETEKQLGGS